MKPRSWAIWLSLVPLALGAMFFASCGGDDDDNGGDDGGGSSSGGTGSDEKFVADLCKAAAKFSTDLEKIDPSKVTDVDKIGETLAKPFEDFSNSFAKLKPPSDLKEWHSDASKALKDSVKALKGGDFENMLDDSSPFPELPKSAADRLTKIADKNDDCKDAEIDLSS